MSLAPPEVRAAKATLAKHRREQRKARTRAKPARETDAGYLAWLHDGLDCIACLIEGRVWSEIVGQPFPIEAAHQYHAHTGPQVGRRPPDAACAPLCAYHHRFGPGCCDPAQRKFWDRLGVDVAAYCRALVDAYKAGQDGQRIVLDFARSARR